MTNAFANRSSQSGHMIYTRAGPHGSTRICAWSTGHGFIVSGVMSLLCVEQANIDS